MDPFKRDVVQWFTKDPKCATHMLMNNGMLCVPENHKDDFHAIYARHVNAGTKVSVCEKLGHSTKMKFFIDVDVKSSPDVYVTEIVEKLQEMCDDITQVYYCSHMQGAHVVTSSVVTCHDAILRAKKIATSFPEDVIDTCVYRSGLRMIGSVKYVRGTCVDRMYLPPSGLPIDTRDVVSSLVCVEHGLPMPTQTLTTLPMDVGNITRLNALVSEIHPMYATCKLGSPRRIGDSIVVGSDSTWCTNKQEYHTSSKVYFVIHKKRCYQKCWCPRNVLRKHGYCREYRSAPIIVPYTMLHDIQQGYNK